MTEQATLQHTVTVAEQQYANTHVVVSTSKPFEKAVKDLQAELGRARDRKSVV